MWDFADMRRCLVAGNWKMNASRAMARELAGTLAAAAAGELADALGDNGTLDVVLCPPFPYLIDVAEMTEAVDIAVGAQDVSPQLSGAFTGDVAAEMLTDLGCRYVLVGHSERRHGSSESDQGVAEKFVRALDAGLIPVLCVGETLAERESGNTKGVVERQINAVLQGPTFDQSQSFVLAYEPVWAIGTGLSASPEQAQEVHAAIRSQLAASAADAESTRVLYGGSVNAGNATQLFAMPDIDGGLIGGASLKATDFLTICRAAGG
jgi:triosephosphate isomerase